MEVPTLHCQCKRLRQMDASSSKTHGPGANLRRYQNNLDFGTHMNLEQKSHLKAVLLTVVGSCVYCKEAQHNYISFSLAGLTQKSAEMAIKKSNNVEHGEISVASRKWYLPCTNNFLFCFVVFFCPPYNPLWVLNIIKFSDFVISGLPTALQQSTK